MISVDELRTVDSVAMKQSIGTQLLQSPEEWGTRNAILGQTMAELVDRFADSEAGYGIEVGCQHGALTDLMVQLTRVGHWTGVDPAISEETLSATGCRLLPGRANELEFPDASFDVVLFANVYEHVPPEERDSSLREMFRVLKPGAVVVGQLPNPYFPIESHSRLPFMGWLPVRLQKKYWRLAPVAWDHDFYVVTIRHLLKTARAAGFDVAHMNGFNYPPEVIPSRVRWAARMLERPMRRLPWAWQFVLTRPQ
jgi:SAM-dependent methyltransferase